jgi:flagellar biosynthesis protein FlhF
MKLKSYFSATVEAAVEQARQELGEDALLVNARPTTPDTRHLGAYEVVFGATGAPQIPAGALARPVGVHASASSRKDAKNDGRPSERLAQDVAEMRREIERLARSLRGGSLAGMVAPTDPSCSGTYSRLIGQELDSGIAQAVAQGAALGQFFETDATLGRKAADRAVIALVGPPGAGKTTTLIKLAARYGLASRKPTQIITTDVFRIAAADQLRSLASILGIGCDVAETPVALAQAIEEHRLKDFVFVDTPGLAGCEMEDGADLASLIAAHPEIDTHLVLPASMKPADMARTIERYAVFQPKKLLFTRLDETDRYGALISEASRCGLPISFLATGQQIPDDLEAASKDRLMELVLGASANGEGSANAPPEPKTAGAAA